MSGVQRLRVSVQEWINAATEDVLQLVEKREEPATRINVVQQQQEEVCITQEVVGRIGLEDTVITTVPVKSEYVEKPQSSHLLLTHTADHREDNGGSEPLHIKEEQEEVCLTHQGVQHVGLEDTVITTVTVKSEDGEKLQSSRLHLTRTVDHKEDNGESEPLHIKEEQEEVCLTHRGVQHVVLVDTVFTTFPVKSEDEDKPQLSHLHLTHTVDHREDDGGSDSTWSSGADGLLSPISEDSATESDGSDNNWTPSSERTKVGAHEAGSGKSTRARLYNCQCCSKRFTLKGNLTKHIRVHLVERPYSCTICGKAFKKSGTLKVHLRTHTEVKLFTCAVCNKRFDFQRQLTEHMKCHRPRKPHGCKLCDKRFMLARGLKKHMAIHENPKQFTCTLCNKGFHLNEHLSVHMKYHNVEKQFICPVCKKGFHVKEHLSRHMKYHTRSEDTAAQSEGSILDAGQLNI